MDTRPYLEVPYTDGGRDLSGWDCWGCVRYVSEHEFNTPLPEYPNAGLKDGAINRRALLEVIQERVSEFVQTNTPQPGDVALLTPRQRPLHIGIIIDTRPLMMLHAERDIGTAVERLQWSMWKNRIEGYYRYVG